MRIGAYSFVNPKTFRGMEGYGFECDIKKGKRTFAYYHEDGNGGMGDLRVEYDENPARFEENKVMAALFEQFALSICPPFPANPELGFPEHPGDIDYFFAFVSTWIELEKSAKSLIRKLPEARMIAILYDKDENPLSIRAYTVENRDEILKILRESAETGAAGRFRKAAIIPAEKSFRFGRFPELAEI